MEFLEHVSLKAFNTFGLEAKARYFAAAQSIDDMAKAVDASKSISADTSSIFLLGGGSNILLTKDYNGPVIKNEIKGIEVVFEDDECYHVKAGAGENWHEFVMDCIANNRGGIENLSLIPGNVGASPMQNIGAYGTEIKDVFIELEALNLQTLEVEKFDRSACEFGYRESVFKRALKGQYCIVSVTYRLTKNHSLNTSYGAIEQELERMKVSELNIKAVSQAVINIRRSKLPDPAEIGNSGSFFKNPVVENSLYEKVKSEYPNVAAYPATESTTKLAAGWLIDQAGWKGETRGSYGVHKNQALVLVNYGGATGKQIYDLSEEVLQSVREKFGVELEREVNIL